MPHTLSHSFLLAGSKLSDFDDYQTMSTYNKAVQTFEGERRSLESHDGYHGNHRKDCKRNDGEKLFGFCLCIWWNLKKSGGETDFPNRDGGLQPLSDFPIASYEL